MPRFELPLYVDLPISKKARSKKNLKRLADGKPWNRHWLTLNKYRNWGSFLEHEIKEAFEPLEIPCEFKAKRIRVSYHFERRGKVKYDVRNSDSVVDKYFMDWMVKKGFIPDDNLYHVEYGESDGLNQCEFDRAICHIEILEK